MSQTAVALIAALIGSVVTLLATFLRGLQERLSARVGAMEVVRSEIVSACGKVGAALKAGQLWPPGYSLRSDAWEANHADLAAHLKTETVRDLDRRFGLLEAAEGLADAVRQESDVGNEDEKRKRMEKLTASLQNLNPELTGATGILDDALADARSRYRRGLGLVGVLIAGLAIAVVLAVSSGSSVTSASVASDLRAHIPSASRAVCEESANWEGTYRCAVEIPACHGQLEASTGGPQCGRQETKIVNVDSGGACDFFYEVARPLGKSQQSEQTKGWTKALRDWICKKR